MKTAENMPPMTLGIEIWTVQESLAEFDRKWSLFGKKLKRKSLIKSVINNTLHIAVYVAVVFILAFVFSLTSCTKTIEQINYIQPDPVKYCKIIVTTKQKQTCYLYDSVDVLKHITITAIDRSFCVDTINWPDSTRLIAEFSTSNQYPVTVDTIGYDGLRLEK